MFGLENLPGYRATAKSAQLGNNRGNKYSKKSTRFSPNSIDFWNFSMDQFAFHDIPDSIHYILETTHQPSLSYVGFSQGTAQAFATLSIHPALNDKVDVFIGLAPAMSPAGLSNGVVDSLVKASPEVIFLAFGRRSILSSTIMWQALLYPPIFTRLIDMSLGFLFGWKAQNISAYQKLAAYPHLYSFTSTKSVVHWFQIIRNKSFQMYDDDVPAPLSLSASDRYYKVPKFPTRNIKTPIVLVFGGSDSLIDIKVMLKELPRHTIAKEIKHFEHLDFLWAQEVDSLVFPHVFSALEQNAGRDHLKSPTFRVGNRGNGRLLGNSSEYSEDEVPIVPRDSGKSIAKPRTASTPSRSPLAESTPSSDQDAVSPPSASSTDVTTVSASAAKGSPCTNSVGPVSAGTLTTANNRQKRRGSFSSAKSLDSPKRFGDQGFKVGAGKATVGGVASPSIENVGSNHGLLRQADPGNDR